VPARLVAATVFKIAVSRVNRAAGGFDSHALPPFLLPYFALCVELAGRRYLDIYSLNDLANPDVIPVHNIVRVAVSKNRFTLAPLDMEKVQRILETNEPGFPVSKIGRRLVLTGSTAELQAFFAKYGDRVFAAERSFKKRPAQVGTD